MEKRVERALTNGYPAAVNANPQLFYLIPEENSRSFLLFPVTAETSAPDSISLIAEYLKETIEKNRPLIDRKRRKLYAALNYKLLNCKTKKTIELYESFGYKVLNGEDEVKKYRQDPRYSKRFEIGTENIVQWFAEKPPMLKLSPWIEQTRAELKHETLNYLYFLIHQHSQAGTKPYDHNKVLRELENTYRKVKRPVGPFTDKPLSLSKDEIDCLVKEEIGRSLISEYVIKDGNVYFHTYAKTHGFSSKQALLSSLDENSKRELKQAIVSLFKEKYVESNGKLKITDFCRNNGGFSTSTFYNYVREETNKGIAELREELDKELSLPEISNHQTAEEKTTFLSRVYSVGKIASRAAAIIGLTISSLFSQNYATLSSQTQFREKKQAIAASNDIVNSGNLDKHLSRIPAIDNVKNTLTESILDHTGFAYANAQCSQNSIIKGIIHKEETSNLESLLLREDPNRHLNNQSALTQLASFH